TLGACVRGLLNSRCLEEIEAFFSPGWKPGSTAGRMPAATSVAAAPHCAVSPNCIQPRFRTARGAGDVSRPAEYNSAIRQSATLRYARGGPSAPETSDFGSRACSQARISDWELRFSAAAVFRSTPHIACSHAG